MNVRRPLFRQPQRRGFTLIELLVVISIIATLAALILPAVQNARATARRTQCQNNLRNVGLAVQAYATGHKGLVPPLTGGFNINYNTVASPTFGAAPWTVHLLPYLEQQALFDRLQVSNNGAAGANSTDTLAQTAIEAYICPDDQNGGNGSLSYVANAGYIASDMWADSGSQDHRISAYDFAFNGIATKTADDAEVAASSGVFWREVGNQGQSNTLDRISSADGTSQTVLLSENINTVNYAPSGGYVGGWVSPYTGEIAFGVSMLGTTTNKGTVNVNSSMTDYGTVGGVSTGSGSKATGLYIYGQDAPVPSVNTIADTGTGPLCKINSNLQAATDGTYPRPSSLHPGVVNMAFADGSCKVMSQEIDESVYCRLLTPVGNRKGQNVVSSSSF